MGKDAQELRARVWANARYWREGLDAIGYYTMGAILGPTVEADQGKTSKQVSGNMADLLGFTE